MNPSELESVWKKQTPIKPAPEEIAKIAAAVCSVDQKFRRKIWWRDLREIGAALTVAAVFGFVGQTWLRWIAVASCLFVAGFIMWSRIRVRSRPEEASVVDQLQQMIGETETQIRLGRSVLWWYLLPCAVATVSFMVDREIVHGRLRGKVDPINLPILAGMMGALYILIYWLNQRAVRKDLEPRRARLGRMLAELRQQS